MILQSLLSYYEALAAKGELPRFGWAKQKVSYALEINEDGELLACLPLLRSDTRGKKTVMVPQEMEVPVGFVRASGICANFLCDNAKYFLGIDTKNPKRSRLCRIESAKRHMGILREVSSPVAQAVCAFFAQELNEDIRTNPVFADAGDDLWESANFVFMVNGQFVQNDAQIKAAWDRFYGASTEEADDNKPDISTGRCLLTGEISVPPKTHSRIMGVPGAQSSGAALVSFNGKAFESFEKDQNLNAPIGKYGAFAYTTALNALIADKAHNKLFGDTLLMYWAEGADPVYQDAFGAFLDPDPAIVTDTDLNEIMQKIVKGRPLDWQSMPLDPSNRFYLLGISPNAARLSVRFFYRDSFGSMVSHLKEHYDRLRMVPDARKLPQMLPLWRLLKETVNPKAQDKSASPQLAGDMLRAVLTGGLYPATLYQQLQIRIRADKEINHERAAVIKAYLLKNMCTEQNKEALTMELNENTTYQPYVLGRLFAVLERIQERASGVTTIKDKFFTSASTTPAAVFPLVVSLAEKHLRKMDGGERVYYSKMMQAMLCMITTGYPTHHTLPDQGIFQLGYYHQKQKFFEKKSNADGVTADSN